MNQFRKWNQAVSIAMLSVATAVSCDRRSPEPAPVKTTGGPGGLQQKTSKIPQPAAERKSTIPDEMADRLKTILAGKRLEENI